MNSADTPTPDTTSPAGEEEETGRANPNWLPRWELFALVAGDLLTILIFALLGRASHRMDISLASFRAVINTAVPFMLAWLIVGTVTGVYTGRALYPLRRVIVRTLVTALVAGPLGVVLRAALLSHPVILSFVLVATGTSTILLVIWRVVWSRLRRAWWPELP
ncbi:MAG TPA: DUF3054 domain-containing protein [Chloroflexi bacterium]|nr:DUF3054 domain-containing protein [Chloroflexota bacterium]